MELFKVACTASLAVTKIFVKRQVKMLYTIGISPELVNACNFFVNASL